MKSACGKLLTALNSQVSQASCITALLSAISKLVVCGAGFGIKYGRLIILRGMGRTEFLMSGPPRSFALYIYRLSTARSVEVLEGFRTQRRMIIMVRTKNSTDKTRRE